MFSKDLPLNLHQIMQDHGFLLLGEVGDLDYGCKAVYQLDECRIPVDVSVFYPENNYLWTATHGGICRCVDTGFCKWRFDAFSTQSFTFLDQEFDIPDPIEHYFNTKYGPDWRTPKNISYRKAILMYGNNRLGRYSISNFTRVLIDEIFKLITLKRFSPARVRRSTADIKS